MNEETRAILQRISEDVSNENASIVRKQIRLILGPVPEPTLTCCPRCKFRQRDGEMAYDGLGEREVWDDERKMYIWSKCPECKGKGLIE
jgi:hypothetical protein